MKEKYLTLEQNTCAARIFLNTFGLILENINAIDEFSEIKIFDKDMNEVGKLYFNNGKVIMSANYSNNILDASFDMAKISSFIDPECKNASFALFGDWASKIIFKVQNKNNIKLFGEFFISCSLDTEYGVSCHCHPLINCEVPEKGKIILKMLRDGSTFSLEIFSKDTYEIIDVKPWDWLNGFLLHDIKNGEYDKEKYGYPYRKYAGIFNGAERGEDKNKLHVFLKEEEYCNQLALRDELSLKAGDDDSEEILLQKGRLMKDLDPNMFEKIKNLREILMIGDFSLLDNLISVCYDDYTDEELNALLGINRKKMNYQNNTNNLVDSYYEIGINCFFQQEIYKKLLKTKK